MYKSFLAYRETSVAQGKSGSRAPVAFTAEYWGYGQPGKGALEPFVTHVARHCRPHYPTEYRNLPPMDHPHAQRRLADALRRQSPRAVPGPEQAHAAQEALDVVAAMAGLKPLALLGQGVNWPGWHEDVAEIAADCGATAAAGGMWIVPGDVHGLPDWYTGSLLAARRGQSTLLVHWDTELGLPQPGRDGLARISQAAEARLLGYPPCCVADHHASQRACHRLRADIIHRQAGGDDVQMRRLAESEVVLRPHTPEDRARWRTATRCVPAPFTSVNMCPACAADAASPARTLSLEYRRLAQETDFLRQFGHAAA